MKVMLRSVKKLATLVTLIEDMAKKHTQEEFNNLSDTLDLPNTYIRVVKEAATTGCLPPKAAMYMATGKKIQAIKVIRDYYNLVVETMDNPVRFAVDLRACKEIADYYWDNFGYGDTAQQRRTVRAILVEPLSGNPLDVNRLAREIEPLL